MLAPVDKHPVDDKNFPSYQSPEYKKMIPYLDFVKEMEDGKYLWCDLYGKVKKPDIAKKVLPMFPGEDEEEWKYRVSITDWTELFKPELQKIPGFINDIKPSETVFSRLLRDMGDIDMDCNSLKKISSLADYLVLRDQLCYLFVDFYNPNKKKISTSDIEKLEDVRPFLKLIDRRDVLNWKYRIKRFEYIVIREEYEENYRYRVIQEDGSWELQEIHMDSEDSLKVVVESEGQISLNQIPVILYSLESISPFSALPPMMGVAELQKSYYNHTSEDRLALIKQGFNILVADTKSVTNANLTGQNKKEKNEYTSVGVTRMMEIPKGHSAGFINPDPSWAMVYENRLSKIKERVTEITRGFIGKTDNRRIYKSKMEIGKESTEDNSGLVMLIEEKLSVLDRIERFWCAYYKMKPKYPDKVFNNFQIDLGLEEPEKDEDKEEKTNNSNNSQTQNKQ